MNLTGVAWSTQLILTLMTFIYVLAIVHPSRCYKICFYKKGVPPTNYSEQTSLSQTIFVIILFFKMQYRKHCFIKICVKHPCQLAFTENFKKQALRGILWKNCSGRSCAALWLFCNCRKYSLQFIANSSTEILLLRRYFYWF